MFSPVAVNWPVLCLLSRDSLKRLVRIHSSLLCSLVSGSGFPTLLLLLRLNSSLTPLFSGILATPGPFSSAGLAQQLDAALGSSPASVITVSLASPGSLSLPLSPRCNPCEGLPWISTSGNSHTHPLSEGIILSEHPLLLVSEYFL